MAMLSVEEKANQRLLKTYRTSLVVCVDENDNVHFDFGGQRSSDMTPERLSYCVASIIVVLKRFAKDSGMTKQGFWDMMMDAVDSVEDMTADEKH